MDHVNCFKDSAESILDITKFGLLVFLITNFEQSSNESEILGKQLFLLWNAFKSIFVGQNEGYLEFQKTMKNQLSREFSIRENVLQFLGLLNPIYLELSCNFVRRCETWKIVIIINIITDEAVLRQIGVTEYEMNKIKIML